MSTRRWTDIQNELFARLMKNIPHDRRIYRDAEAIIRGQIETLSLISGLLDRIRIVELQNQGIVQTALSQAISEVEKVPVRISDTAGPRSASDVKESILATLKTLRDGPSQPEKSA